MRILVAGPPKTGNVWIENLLAATYQLMVSPPVENLPSVEDFQNYVDRGQFLDGIIFHHHYRAREPLFETASRSGIHLVTTIRNPYDMFVSMYFYVQNFSDNFINAKDPASTMIGRSIDDRRIMRYLKREFGKIIQVANDWKRNGQSIVVHYEALHDDIFREMKRVTDLISPVDDAVIHTAIAACRADVLKQRSDELKRHIRLGSVGDWRNHLNEKHLRIFRSRYANLIESIGYTVE